jgi:hypothetical protein
MSLYSQATLAFFPSGYKETKAFSVVPSSGDGDFTFSRTTDAYRLNGSNIVQKAPYNLIGNSQTFNNWSQNACTIVADVVAAPDGTMTADSFSETATTAQHLVRQDPQYLAGYTYTASVYAKAGNQSTLVIVMSFTAFGSNWRTAYFNLSNGTVISNNNNSGIAPTITSVGNGWYRCTFTNTCTTTISDSLAFGKEYFSHLGDGQVNLYLWGAQLEARSSASTYFPTTNRQNVPQLDWEGSTCPYLNMDNTSTNLFTYSEDFTFNGAWGQNRCTMTANVAIAPNGTMTADLFTTTSTTIECMLRASISSAVNNVTQTTSVYVKRDTANYFRIRNLSMGGNAWFNLTNGTIGTIQGGQTARIFNVGNGWYRCTLTGTKGVSATDLFDIGFTDADNTQYPSSTVSGYLWGAQLETRVVATSYIPTGAATATRNIQGLSVANLQATNILSSNFTLYSEFIDYKFSNNSGIHIFGVGNATATDWLSIYRNFSSLLKISKKENNVVTDTNNLSVQVAEGNTIKVAIRCNAGTVRIYINGQIAYNTTFANPSLMTNSRFFQLDAGNLNSAMVKSILLYNTALTDTECVKLTTL